MKLSEFAKECRDTWKEDRSGVPVVGLEHLEPGEVKLSVWDVNSENTFTKRFNKGQVLLGRRRVYLRKAVVAPFDGICSGDITVIEAIPGKILPELLPFVIQNDAFFDYAEQGSAGSLSPRVKWEHLKDFEVNLPPIDEQKVLAEKLWAAYRLKESYKKLLAATDEMVKSRFIEMFGDPMTNSKHWTDYELLKDVTEIVLGSTPNSKNPKYWDGTINWITPAELSEQSYFVYDTERHITKEGFLSANLTIMPIGTVLFSTRAPIGKVAITGQEMCCNQGFKNFVCSNRLNNVFLYYTLKFKKDYLCSLGTGTTFKELSKKVIETLRIAVPPIELQNEFEQIYNQADKSGFELRKSIENIDSVIKSLINN
ncbi:MAG: restriction endonuclease subunit S [Fibrobacter sp.]|nr:restriction endonuclease subunit S [Fibrobacter sp.]